MHSPASRVLIAVERPVGVLKQGCSSTPGAHITNCYSLSLTSNATQQLDSGFPDSPRQRIEFLTKGSADGTSHTYKWRYYLSSQTGTTTRFFHLMQVFSRGDNAAIVTLDAVKGQFAVEDNFRNCSVTRCPSVAISQFTDRTTLHAMTVTFGPTGKLRYIVTDADTGANILSYTASGKMGSQSTSLKFGLYRATVSGMTAASANLGDFTSS
ncbi:hypothetical protein GLOTRDRAFT_129646 [Gloeophyllum trabeum ATCC 11539]|uniref:Uncharacterized protein n=1 Tax=Gloeophyllum trabeum (strain ATCC 11539 / FP-39264 / Madison 617) TaxID=670483 RepID=S7Q773_GLOTA|nr:uncharacterized protein GLOTRDRAFT_129646 [Gloeophyllum trabeum ATCC 11539]EPQ55372.1 hypothetical protein GLOTRDRAFT_129646 [Gloeophyllum trabeum ATCC 11539]